MTAERGAGWAVFVAAQACDCDAFGQRQLERWLPIPGYMTYYQASDLGRIRRVARTITYKDGRVYRHRGRVLSQARTRDGRRCVSLCTNGIARTRLVHHLVLHAFVGPRPRRLVGCHENGDHADNRLSNLRWDTQSSNMLDKTRHGTDHYRQRTSCPLEHLLVAPNLRACDARMGHRACLACNRARADRVRAKRRGIPFDFQSAADTHYARIMGVAR
jgi:hypothetical protein